jgi:hypothetical protein
VILKVGAAILNVPTDDYTKNSIFLRYLLHLAHFHVHDVSYWEGQICFDLEQFFVPLGRDSLGQIRHFYGELAQEDDDIHHIEILYSTYVKKPSILVEVMSSNIFDTITCYSRDESI